MTLLIDVHHHPTLRSLSRRQEQAGIPRFAGMPEWTPQIAIEQMGVTGTAASVLSSPGDLSWIPDGSRPAAVQELNDELADLIREAPDRFGAFGTLPLPDPDAAAAEAVRVLDVLRLEGVCMLTSYQGTYLSEPRFEPLLQELDARDAVVFVHPILVRDAPAGLSPALLEGTFDTTRFATALAAADVFERFPRIRFVLPHTGGMVPYIKWRIALFALQRGDWRVQPEPEEFEREIRKLDGIYYDTTLNLGPVLDLVRRDRLLFGTDIPWAGDAILCQERDFVLKTGAQWSPEQAEAVASGNALRLFPGLGARLGR